MTVPADHSVPTCLSDDILIIDDTDGSLKFLAKILTHAGYTVHTADRASFILHSIKAQLPVLILLDVRMPTMDAYALCRRLKADAETRAIPVIFLGESLEFDKRLDGFAAGAVDFITKPFNDADVLARVAAHIALYHARQDLERKNAQLLVEAQKHKQAKIQLQEAKTKAETYLNIVADVILGLDTKGTITLLNDSGHSLLGYEKGELIGKNWFDTCLPEGVRTEIHGVFSKLMAGDCSDVQAHENAVITKSGGRRDLLWHNSLLRDSTGHIIGEFSSAEDITEHKQATRKFEIQNKELLFQNEEKGKRAAELIIANEELIFQNEEKEKRAAELVVANKELLFQNEEKEKRSAELVVANKELLFQNKEKEKRAAELVVANKELLFQNEEKEKRAAELVVANKELLFQNKEKEKRAAELVVANKELLFQNEEKEKRAAELIIANEETVQRLQNIQALHKIDQAIAGSLDLTLTLNVILEQVKTQLNADAVAILLLNQYTHILEFASGLGFRSKAIERSRLRLGEGLGGQAVLERKTVSITNLLDNDTQFIRASLLVGEGFSSYFATPLIAKGQITGLLEVYNRSPFTPDENWLEFFKILAGQAAIAVDSASLFAELKQSNEHLFAAYDSTIEGWSHALDLRDKETEGHTQRVMEMTLILGQAARISGEDLLHMRRGALLHDIGKMGVPDSILLKPGKLTDEEWVVMRMHPTFAFELLSPIAYLYPALDIPYCHHEKWDGSGYPRGLKSEQIPLAARLFAVVDVWDALCSDRPYRQGWPREKVLDHIRSLSGTHFDPKAVELFLEVINEDAKSTAR